MWIHVSSLRVEIWQPVGMYIVIVLLYRDLPLSTTSFSVEMIGASKRLYIKDSSIGMHIIYMYTCTLYIVHAYVYTLHVYCVWVKLLMSLHNSVNLHIHVSIFLFAVQKCSCMYMYIHVSLADLRKWCALSFLPPSIFLSLCVGRVTIQLSDLPNGQDDDKWHQLMTKTSRTSQGSVRLVANFKVRSLLVRTQRKCCCAIMVRGVWLR